MFPDQFLSLNKYYTYEFSDGLKGYYIIHYYIYINMQSPFTKGRVKDWKTHQIQGVIESA